MMRVAYVCADPGIPVFGHKGSSVHVQEIVRALRRRGASVELFAARVGGPPPADLADVIVHELGRAKADTPRARELLLLGTNPRLRRALEATDPFDLVYERYSLWSFAGMSYARATGTARVLEVNAPLVDEQAEHRVLVDRAGAEQVASAVFDAAGTVVAVSRGVADWVSRRATSSTRVHVVPNGVDSSRFAPRPPAVNGPTFTIGFVGTLKRWHGTDVLVEAFRRLAARDASVRLLLVGDGPERERLEQLVHDHGLTPRVTFAGAVAPWEVPWTLAGVDAAVAPYPQLVDSYFSPLKVYEYLAAGLPMVASRVGQVPELLRDGVHGILVDPGDPHALAAALAALHRDPALRTRLGASGRARVLRSHTWERVIERTLTYATAPAAMPVRTAAPLPARSLEGVA